MTADLLRPSPRLSRDCRQAVRCLAAFALLLGITLATGATLVTWLRMPLEPLFLPLGEEHRLVFGGDTPATALPLLARALVTAGWLVLGGLVALVVLPDERWLPAEE